MSTNIQPNISDLLRHEATDSRGGVYRHAEK